MITMYEACHAYDTGPVTIRAFSSLTPEHHAQVIIKAVQRAAPEWEVDLLDDYDGYLSVLISTKKMSDCRPSYLISGTVQHIELFEVRDDTLRKLGAFGGSMQPAVEALLVSLCHDKTAACSFTGD